MTYGYVCTNYNNAHFTVTAVESLMAGDIPPSRIVVVDNASTPADLEILKTLASRYPDLDLVANPENVGYFPGLNVGIRRLRAWNASLDHMVVGNNDLEFPAEFGAILEARRSALAAHPVIAPDIVTLDGVHQNPHVAVRISPLREMIYDIYYANFALARLVAWAARLTRGVSARKDTSRHDIAGSIHSGIGACYILTARFFELFDELWAPSFLMGEEYFLTRQLEEKGMSMYYEPALSIKHRCNGAVEKISNQKIWRYARDAHRLRRRYVRRWRTGAGDS